MPEQLHYQCSKGHMTDAPAHVQITRCPVCVKGRPCPGDMSRIGRGSRAGKSSQQRREPAMVPDGRLEAAGTTFRRDTSGNQEFELS